MFFIHIPLISLHKYRSVHENKRSFRKPPLLGPPLSCAKERTRRLVTVAARSQLSTFLLRRHVRDVSRSRYQSCDSCWCVLVVFVRPCHTSPELSRCCVITATVHPRRACGSFETRPGYCQQKRSSQFDASARLSEPHTPGCHRNHGCKASQFGRIRWWALLVWPLREANV